MAAMIQTEKTSLKKGAMSRYTLVVVLAVLAAHIVVLAALCIFDPKPMPKPEPPKPIAVRFIQNPPAKPELSKPAQPKPKTPKELPKKQVKPKEVKAAKVQPKSKPAAKPKTKSVLSTKTASKQPQQKIVPHVSDAEPDSKTKTEPDPQPKPKPESEAKPKPESEAKPKPEPDPKPLTPPAPVLVEGVSYIKPPRLSITERDLKGRARTVSLKINIGTSGKVESVQVVSSSGINALDQKVASTWRKATFNPHRVNGVAVPVYTIQSFELNLPK